SRTADVEKCHGAPTSPVTPQAAGVGDVVGPRHTHGRKHHVRQQQGLQRLLGRRFGPSQGVLRRGARPRDQRQPGAPARGRRDEPEDRRRPRRSRLHQARPQPRVVHDPEFSGRRHRSGRGRTHPARGAIRTLCGHPDGNRPERHLPGRWSVDRMVHRSGRKCPLGPRVELTRWARPHTPSSENDMKYMLLIYGNETTWNELYGDAFDDVMREHEVLAAELAASDEFVESQGLTTRGAMTVRVRDDTATVTDGPFTEAKEAMAGYYLVDCADAGRARGIAAAIPEARIDLVDIRRDMDPYG